MRVFSGKRGSKTVRGQLPYWSRILRCAAVVVARLKDLAPYAAIEFLLPGGSVIALTLWFYRRRKRAPATPVSNAPIPLGIAST